MNARLFVSSILGLLSLCSIIPNGVTCQEHNHGGLPEIVNYNLPVVIPCSDISCSNDPLVPKPRKKRQVSCSLEPQLIDDFNDATRFRSRKNILGGWQDGGGTLTNTITGDGKLSLTLTGTGGYYYTNFFPSCFSTTRHVLAFSSAIPAGGSFNVEIQIRSPDCVTSVAKRYLFPVTTSGAIAINLASQIPTAEFSYMQAVVFSGFSGVFNQAYLIDDLRIQNDCSSSTTSTTATSTPSPTCATTIVDNFDSGSQYGSGFNLLGGRFGSGSVTLARTAAGKLEMTPSINAYFYTNLALDACFNAATRPLLQFKAFSSAAASMSLELQTRSEDCLTRIAKRFFFDFSLSTTEKTFAVNLKSDLGLTDTELTLLNAIVFSRFSTTGIKYTVDDIALSSTGCTASTTTPASTTPTSTPTCPLTVLDNFESATTFGTSRNLLAGTFGAGGITFSRTAAGKLSLTRTATAHWFYENLAANTCFDATARPVLQFKASGPAGATFVIEFQIRSTDCVISISKRMYRTFTITTTEQLYSVNMKTDMGFSDTDLRSLNAIVWVSLSAPGPYFIDDVAFLAETCSPSSTTSTSTSTSSVPTPTGPAPSPDLDWSNSIVSCGYYGTFGLTYDDGPDSDITPLILASLARAGLRVTFFTVGQRIEQSPGLVRQAYNAGHVIASHSYTHRDFTTLTNDQILDELRTNERLIFGEIGKYPRYFRFPYGAIDPRVKSIVEGRGYKVIWLNYDTNDWQTSSGDKVYNDYVTNFQSVTVANTRPISLQHDIQPSSRDAADRLYAFLKNKGYNVIPISECLGEASYRDTVPA